jgi:cytochrome P450
MSEAARRPPGSLPVVGHLHRYLPDKLGFLERAARGGDAVRLELGETAYLLNSAGDIQHVLEANHANYDKGERVTGAGTRRIAGEGLLTMTGERHLRQRRMLAPIFHKHLMARFAGIVDRCTQEMLAGWRGGQVLDVCAPLMELPQRVIAKVLFGGDFDDERFYQAGQAVRKLWQHRIEWPVEFLMRLPLPVVRSYRRAARQMDEVFFRQIASKRRTGGDDLLTDLIAARRVDGGGMTDREIRDELLVLSVTGYETIGESLAWSVHMLARHPAAQQRVSAEFLSGGEMTYTDQVYSECLRLYPPTWIFVRRTKSNDVLPTGTRIPARSKVYLCPWVVHRLPKYFPEPSRFDPARFGAEAIAKRPKYAYFPFGGGPRVCLGQFLARIEATRVLGGIVSRFALDEGGRPPRPAPRLTLEPEGGVWIHLRNRQ